MAKFSSLTSSGVTLSGSTGTWAAGLVSGNVMGWNGTLNIQKINATTKSSAGWQEMVDGLKSFRGTVRMAADDTTPLKADGGAPGVKFNLYSNTRKITGLFRVSETSIEGNDHGPEGSLPVVTFNVESTGSVTIA
jgi:hypothetical protein